MTHPSQGLPEGAAIKLYKTLHMMANLLQDIGEMNVPGDSELIYASKKERDLLKARGGSGEKDPFTGIPHYREAEGIERDSGNEQDAGDGPSRDAPDVGGGEGPGGDYASGRPTRSPSDVRPSQSAFGGEGSVDPNAVMEGRAYGIDPGPRKHDWGSFWRGFRNTGSLLGGLGGWARGSPGTPAVNGGGWGMHGGTRNPDGTPTNTPGGGSGRDFGGEDTFPQYPYPFMPSNFYAEPTPMAGDLPKGYLTTLQTGRNDLWRY